MEFGFKWTQRELRNRAHGDRVKMGYKVSGERRKLDETRH